MVVVGQEEDMIRKKQCIRVGVRGVVISEIHSH